MKSPMVSAGRQSSSYLPPLRHFRLAQAHSAQPGCFSMVGEKLHFAKKKSVRLLRWAKARWLDPILKILQNLYQPRSCHWLKVVDTRRVVANLVNLGNRWKLGPDESLSYIFMCRPYIIGNSSFSGAVLRYLPC